MDGQSAAPAPRTILVADVKCLMCGAILGTLEREEGAPRGAGRFVPVGSAGGQPVLHWRSLRCPRCGGHVYLDDFDVQRRAPDRADLRNADPSEMTP